jgi:hypothetical protein
MLCATVPAAVAWLKAAPAASLSGGQLLLQASLSKHASIDCIIRCEHPSAATAVRFAGKTAAFTCLLRCRQCLECERHFSFLYAEALDHPGQVTNCNLLRLVFTWRQHLQMHNSGRAGFEVLLRY